MDALDRLLAMGTNELQAFFLVLSRMLGLFSLSPVLSSRFFPLPAKVGLAAMTSLIVLPTVPIPAGGMPADLVGFGLCVCSEALVGALLGYAAFVVFIGAQVAGEIVDIQMGFGLANVVDPISNIQVSVMGQFNFLLAVLLFLVMDGHHRIIEALVTSFRSVPLTRGYLDWGMTGGIVRLFADAFAMAVRIGAPVMACLFVCDVALGIVARTVPQMNVLVVGFPLKIAVGLLLTAIVLPVFGSIFADVVTGMGRTLASILAAPGAPVPGAGR